MYICFIWLLAMMITAAQFKKKQVQLKTVSWISSYISLTSPTSPCFYYPIFFRIIIHLLFDRVFPTRFPRSLVGCHPRPVVHGLWPQNGNFGTSECGKADNVADPRRIYPCTFGCKLKKISWVFWVEDVWGIFWRVSLWMDGWMISS